MGSYLAQLRQMRDYVRAQGEALRRGQWEVAQRLAGRIEELQRQISAGAPPAEEMDEVLPELASLKKEVDAQIGVLRVLSEEATREIAAAARWCRDLRAFWSAPGDGRSPLGQRFDART